MCDEGLIRVTSIAPMGFSDGVSSVSAAIMVLAMSRYTWWLDLLSFAFKEAAFLSTSEISSAVLFTGLVQKVSPYKKVSFITSSSSFFPGNPARGCARGP